MNSNSTVKYNNK